MPGTSAAEPSHLETCCWLGQERWEVSRGFAVHRMFGLAMEKAASCRQRAAECLALARMAADPAHKRLFVEMASSWRDLAALVTVYSQEAARSAKPPRRRLDRPDQPPGMGRE
jgi:hypothetical protein